MSLSNFSRPAMFSLVAAHAASKYSVSIVYLNGLSTASDRKAGMFQGRVYTKAPDVHRYSIPERTLSQESRRKNNRVCLCGLTPYHPLPNNNIPQFGRTHASRRTDSKHHRTSNIIAFLHYCRGEACLARFRPDLPPTLSGDACVRAVRRIAMNRTTDQNMFHHRHWPIHGTHGIGHQHQ